MEDGKVLIVQYKDGSWTYPKGHIEENEAMEVTAQREVLEEAGIESAVERKLGVSHYVNHKGIPREVHWFVMRAVSSEVQLESTFMAGGFYLPAQALELLSFPEDQQLLRQALGLQEA
ncbi:diadenosine hexaphosphate hydrolase [Deinococcus roseus]|uniref:Diadenosine hexaphosphate hydrolase n=2 Tax=Deinococcus roseus TaxID=392414 RepID=A0ABQ2CWD5_9DEIO|nr:diadenosine hexaphosphate hydrolase [Deinococcus roseus]